MGRRQARDAAVILSLLASTASLILWARSLAKIDRLSHARGIEVDGRYAQREWTVTSIGGFVEVVSVPTQFAARRWIKARRAARRAGFPVDVPTVRPDG